MAQTSRLCLICGQVFSSHAERVEHMEREHPGQRVAWHGKRPWLVDADGTETIIGAAALKRMRATAHRVTGGQQRPGTRPAARVRRPRPEPAPEPAPMVETPTGDPDAPPYFTQAQPPHFDAAGAPVGPEPTAGAGELPPAPTAEVSRATLRLALDQPTLAELIRNASIVVSDWDGAGEAGHLSRIEAGQLAMLLHEPALDVVARYFGGDVNRFKLALAAAILLLGKGRVHVNAVRRQQLARQLDAGPEPVEAARLASTPAEPVELAPEPAEAPVYDPVADLARRQHEWRTTPRHDE